MQRTLAIIGLGLLVGCQTLPEVKPYEPQKHCDTETMERAKTMPRNEWVNGRQVGQVMDALSECGQYTHGIASHNTAAAQELTGKTSRLQPLKDYALAIESAILIALMIAAALL